MAVAFDNDLERSVVGPFQAEKSCHKVFRALQHAVLGSGSGNDLGAGVVKVTIVIVVQNARIEESEESLVMIRKKGA